VLVVEQACRPTSPPVVEQGPRWRLNVAKKAGGHAGIASYPKANRRFWIGSTSNRDAYPSLLMRLKVLYYSASWHCDDTDDAEGVDRDSELALE